MISPNPVLKAAFKVWVALEIIAGAITVEQLNESVIGQLLKSDHPESDDDGIHD